jgi:hypothetical protein
MCAIEQNTSLNPGRQQPFLTFRVKLPQKRGKLAATSFSGKAGL